MRLLYVSDNGSDHNLRFLARFSAEGHEVFYLVLGHASPWNRLPRGVSCVSLKAKATRISTPEQAALLLPEFHALLSNLCPDMVYAGPVQTAGYLAALSGFHPLIVMSWGSDLLVDAHRSTEWEKATEIALHAADGFVCDCETVRQAALEYAPIPTSRTVQLPWGIEPGTFCPSGQLPSCWEGATNSEAIPLICTRSWEPLYRIDMLLAAFLQAYTVDHRLRLILVGHGSDAKKIRAFIFDNSLQGTVLTPGQLPHAELPNWFRVAKAYVSCAKSDGTSVSLLEAMSTGLPAIVSDIPSNREWVTHSKNGWLASDIDQFAQSFLRVSNLTMAERRAISAANRTIVLQRADWEKNSVALVRLCELLGDERKAVSQ